MLFPIETKANVDGRVPDALHAVAPLLPDPDAARRIFFAEDIDCVGTGETPLLSGSVIGRNRIGDDRDDATATLQPCDEAQLRGDWSAPFDEPPQRYRIEGDPSRRRRVLAASAMVEDIAGELLGSVGVGGDAPDALTGPSADFCGKPPRRASLSTRTQRCWTQPTVGDALDNGLAEATIALYKTEYVRDGARFRGGPLCTLRPCIKPGMLRSFALRGG